MHNSKSVVCYHCKSIILMLPDVQIRKLDGLHFICECCGHQNQLMKSTFKPSDSIDPTLSIFSVETGQPPAPIAKSTLQGTY